jgi:hypothetical protein
MLVPGDPGSIGIHIYVCTVEYQHFIYAVTVETPRPEQGRHAHLLSYICNLATRGGKEHFMYAVPVETL